MAGIVVAGGGAILTSITLFSVFFTYQRGPIDSILAYGTYFHRAGGAGLHDHPWTYYLGLLWSWRRAPGPLWTEAPILVLFVVGAGAILFNRGVERTNLRFLKFVLYYTIMMTATYSLIPYKTPWCALGFLHGMIVIAGVGAVALSRAARHPLWRVTVAAAVAAAGGCLIRETRLSNGRFCCDARNPYVYAHPTRGPERLGEFVERLAWAGPNGYDTLIKIISPDYWPLPWYLRRFHRVGYWEEIPDDVDAPIVIASRDLHPQVEAAMKDSYQTWHYSLRPDVLLIVRVRNDLWDRFVEREKTRAP